MSSTINVRDIKPGDKSWLKYEAHRFGVSMEELVRRIMHEKRMAAGSRAKPSEAFKRYFGPDHGIELPPFERCGYRSVEFSGESET